MTDGLDGLFENLKCYLESNLPWLNEVRLYNSQDINAEDHQYVTPIIFIDFDSITPDTQSYDAVLHSLKVVVKIYTQDYSINYTNAFKDRKEVFDLLYNYSQDFFALYYESQHKDKKATHLNMWDINFSCKCWETINHYTDVEVNGTSGLAFDTSLNWYYPNGEGTNFIVPPQI